MGWSSPPKPPTCADVADNLEAFLDGEIEATAAAALSAHLATCSNCQEEQRLARLVGSELRALPQLACPDRVTAAVLEEAGPEHHRGWAQRAGVWLAAAAVLLLSVAVWWRLVDKPESLEVAGISTTVGADSSSTPSTTPDSTPDSTELDQAERELKLAMAYFAKVSDRVTEIVRDDVIARRVTAAPFAALAAIDRMENRP